MVSKQKREFVFLILSGIFISNALLAELIGGKLVGFAGFTLSLGVIQWPIVFITTDLINEYFGKRGVRNLSIFTAILIGYAFLVLYIGMKIPAVDFSPVKDDMFANVFGQSMWIIIGSLAAFLLSQGVDVAVFWLVRARTEGKMLWLRSTGSTVVSQIVDTYVVLFIAFYLPGQLGVSSRAMTLSQYIQTANSNYIYKMLIAVAMTPFIYMGHNAIERVLGHAQSEELMRESARESLKEA